MKNWRDYCERLTLRVINWVVERKKYFEVLLLLTLLPWLGSVAVLVIAGIIGVFVVPWAVLYCYFFGCMMFAV